MNSSLATFGYVRLNPFCRNLSSRIKYGGKNTKEAIRVKTAATRLIGYLSARLKSRGFFLCTAESCTGGLAAKICTDMPGSSEWFAGGVVSYSDRLKTRLLGVPEDLIAVHGAVSLEVARSMAAGVVRACTADCAVAFSGIAGPGGGSTAKPVGKVCIAVAVSGASGGQGEDLRVQAYTRFFSGSRPEIRLAAVIDGFNTLFEMI
jgi:nicotinamide-nucleotide amidase